MTTRNYKLYFPSQNIIIKTDILANVTNHYQEHGYRVIKSSIKCVFINIRVFLLDCMLSCSQCLQSLSPGSVTDQPPGNIFHLCQVLSGSPQVLPGLSCRNLESPQCLTQSCGLHTAAGVCRAGHCRAGHCRAWNCRARYCRSNWSWSQRRLGRSGNI